MKTLLTYDIMKSEKKEAIKMKRKYELRKWNDDDSITTVLKINDEPKSAKKRAKEYANEHEGIYSLYKVEEVKIYFNQKKGGN